MVMSPGSLWINSRQMELFSESAIALPLRRLIGLPWYLSWLRICLQCRRPQFDSWVGKICWRIDRLPTPVFLGFLCGSAVKNPPAMWQTSIWSLGWEDLLEKGKATHIQYSGLENSMDYIVRGVTMSRTWLTDFHFLSLSGGSSYDQCILHSVSNEWYYSKISKQCISDGWL